jgi:hypothetical protein
MDDRQFAQELAALDQGIAERWKKVTGGRLKTPIGMNGVDAIIIIPVFKTGKITAGQAKAIRHLLAYAKFSKNGLVYLVQAVAIAYNWDYFFAGSATALVTPEQLKEFHASLGMGNVGKINFASPKTGLSYSPDLYTAIRGLVHEGRVTVFAVDAGALLSRSGTYRSDLNRLVLYKGLAPEFTMQTIVHEATHTIQDWRNVATTMKYIEADAYIAMAVAALSVSKQPFLEYPAQEAAGRLVLAGKAVPTNAEWMRTYDEVVKAVEGDPTYADNKNLQIKWDEDGKSSDEKALLTDIMQRIKTAEDFVDAFADTLKATFDPREHLKQILGPMTGVR